MLVVSLQQGGLQMDLEHVECLMVWTCTRPRSVQEYGLLLEL